MYQFKYIVKKKGGYTETLLHAKFRFSNEVAPKERETIRERINNKIFFGNYFEEVEGFKFVSPTRGVISIAPQSKKTLNLAYCFPLGFNIRVTSPLQESLERIINLDKLNDFVMTGKVNN